MSPSIDHETTPVVQESPNSLARIPPSNVPRPQTDAPGQPVVRPVPRHFGGGKLLGIGALVATVLVGMGVAGTLPRLRREHELKVAAAEAASSPPTVSVVVARPAPADRERLLPGNSLPWFETELYARTNGYLQRRLVDIGDSVEAGQLLAQIDTPEVDDQLNQARATLAQTTANLERDKANKEFADVELERVTKLKKQGSISHEEHDRQGAATKVASAAVQATEATIKLNEADVQRLTDLQSFEKITAPFRGIITLRNYDVGALMISDNRTMLPLFRLAQIDTLRVMVAVPQVYSTEIYVGQAATIFRREDPQRKFAGKVTRMATALDPNTRTMLTQVEVPNPDSALLPGMYLQVKFVTRKETSRVLIPAAALVIGAEGVSVAVVDEKSVVHYVKVEIRHDYGAEVEVTAGLNGGETVVVHPGDAIPEGTLVQIAAPVPPSDARR
jgi:membrane fusion protein, multidrug efflux system